MPTLITGPFCSACQSRDHLDRGFAVAARCIPSFMPLLLECPRASPAWEFCATVALVKPQFRSRVAHARRAQVLPRGARRRIEQLVDAVAARFASPPRAEFYARRAIRFCVTFAEDADLRRARRLSIEISRALPSLWLRFDGRLLHRGRFYRTQGRYRLVPQASPGVRLPFELYRLVAGGTF